MKQKVLAALRPYRFSVDQLRHRGAAFQLALTECAFRPADEVDGFRSKYSGAPGIYLWALRAGDEEYRIYVGQTSSITYRLGNYYSPFQPHAPNDFKLRIFHAFLSEAIPDGVLDLYFARLKGKYSKSDRRVELRRLEKLAIARYEPLLNRKTAPDAHAKVALQAAFEAYYRAGLQRLLLG